MNSDILFEIEKTVNNSKRIALASHIAPDGDNVGSVMGFGSFLEKLGKEVYYLKTDELPNHLLFLPDLDNYSDDYQNLSIDLFIALDVADPHRLGDAYKIFKSSPIKLNIDHHITNNHFGDINYIDANASSTGELVYRIIKYMSGDFDKKTALYLYTAISMDTGRFLYSNTTEDTFNAVAELVKTGFDKDFVNQNLWQSKQINAAHLYMDALNHVEFFAENKISFAAVTLSMAKKWNSNVDDTEDIINFIRDIDSVEVAILIKQKGNQVYKASLRSKNYVDVSKIAEKLGGGGHKRASGLTYHGTFDELKETLITLLVKEI